jgi:cytochrome c oxidase cbb3-type subunit III
MAALRLAFRRRSCRQGPRYKGAADGVPNVISAFNTSPESGDDLSGESPAMQMKNALMALTFAATAGWFAPDLATQTAGPAAGPQQEGRGAGPGREGGPPGRGRGPNFPQHQRPPGDPEVIARGRALYGVNCAACHGADLRGGDQGGPNLLRSEIVLTDDKGENILSVVRRGREGPGGMMPAFHLPENDMLAIAEYIHSVMSQTGRQGRPPERDTPFELNVLVGDATAGQAYFAKACSRCHSAGGDLQGIAARTVDPRALQNLWVSGGASGRGGGRGEDPGERRVRVTVTAPGTAPVSGRLVRIDDFIVSLVQDDGVRRTFSRNGAVPKVEISDPLQPHRLLALELTDRDMHDVTAYLATLK